MISLYINDRHFTIDADGETPLLWVIREQVGLTGTKYGCGIAACGACTVHMDGRAVRACTLPLRAAAGHHITTIEGLSRDRSHPLQQAWIAHQVPQCGYCQSGMIMAAAALLAEKPHPTDETSTPRSPTSADAERISAFAKPCIPLRPAREGLRFGRELDALRRRVRSTCAEC